MHVQFEHSQALALAFTNINYPLKLDIKGSK